MKTINNIIRIILLISVIALLSCDTGDYPQEGPFNVKFALTNGELLSKPDSNQINPQFIDTPYGPKFLYSSDEEGDWDMFMVDLIDEENLIFNNKINISKTTSINSAPPYFHERDFAVTYDYTNDTPVIYYSSAMVIEDLVNSNNINVVKEDGSPISTGQKGYVMDFYEDENWVVTKNDPYDIVYYIVSDIAASPQTIEGMTTIINGSSIKEINSIHFSKEINDAVGDQLNHFSIFSYRTADGLNESMYMANMGRLVLPLSATSLTEVLVWAFYLIYHNPPETDFNRSPFLYKGRMYFASKLNNPNGKYDLYRYYAPILYDYTDNF